MSRQLNILFPSAQERDLVDTALRTMAEQFGMVQKFGRGAGRGHLPALLAAIAAGTLTRRQAGELAELACRNQTNREE
jgi:hypothetical protein